jgi:hypothetical protein
MRAWLLSIVVVGCGAPRDATPSNTAESSAVRVAPGAPLGELALATTPAFDERTEPGIDRERAAYVPVSTDHPVVTLAEVPVGATLSVLGVAGGVARFTAGARTEIQFGCEQNTLAVTPLAGPRLPAGPAWILPRPLPATWALSPLAIAPSSATETSRRYTVGPLTVELTRTAPARGTLAIQRAGRTVHTVPFERVLMEGAAPELATIDLRSDGPGIPAPIGAWSLAPGGPALVVLLQPGWEGATLATFLVEESTARAVESMTTYLYYCAF